MTEAEVNNVLYGERSGDVRVLRGYRVLQYVFPYYITLKPCDMLTFTVRMREC